MRKRTEMGADVKMHDPSLDHWRECEAQDICPRPDNKRIKHSVGRRPGGAKKPKVSR
jgi:hypothetical protein